MPKPVETRRKEEDEDEYNHDDEDGEMMDEDEETDMDEDVDADNTASSGGDGDGDDSSANVNVNVNVKTKGKANTKVVKTLVSTNKSKNKNKNRNSNRGGDVDGRDSHKKRRIAEEDDDEETEDDEDEDDDGDDDETEVDEDEDEDDHDDDTDTEKRKNSQGKKGVQGFNPVNKASSRGSNRAKKASSSRSCPSSVALQSIQKLLEVDHRQAASASSLLAASSAAPLIITGDKRRGVYECDVCRKDLSQVPRIRCADAVCCMHEFDLCLECFVQTNQSLVGSSSSSSQGAGASQHSKAAAGHGNVYTSTGLSQHKATHSYRVADSTRYVSCPTTKWIDVQTTTTMMTSKQQTESCGDDDAKVVDDMTTAETLTAMLMDEHDKNETSGTSMKDGQTTNKWTVEEDLRLLDGIQTQGLGNWIEIAEVLGGTKNTARKCMERYWDDYCGTYNHNNESMLPPITFAYENNSGNGKDRKTTASSGVDLSKAKLAMQGKPTANGPTACLPTLKLALPKGASQDEEEEEEDDKVQFAPGTRVNRYQNYKTELEAVKALEMASTKEEATRIYEEYKKKSSKQIQMEMNNLQVDAEAETESEVEKIPVPLPSLVIPPRVQDVEDLPGSALAGYMPRRGDFDVEWDNDAETVLADMEFSAEDTQADKALKTKMLKVYNAKLRQRLERKQFITDRGLLDYKKQLLQEMMRPPEERDLIQRMRLFARFHSKQEHDELLQNILKAKTLQKEIAKLQQYRQMGITTLAQKEKHELDQQRQKVHDTILKSRVSSSTAKVVNEEAILLSNNETQHENNNDNTDYTYRKTIRSMPGAELLSSKEVALVASLKPMTPHHYLLVKRALLQESLQAGSNILHQYQTEADSKKLVYTLEAHKKNHKIVDFFLRAGWITSKQQLQEPQPQQQQTLSQRPKQQQITL
jgi:transcriptional adapter 2-alpha